MKTTLGRMVNDTAKQLVLAELTHVKSDTFFGSSIVMGFRNSMHEDIIITVRDQVKDNEAMCRRVCGDKAIDLIKKYF